MSKAASTPAGPGRRPRTSREEIVECAIRMLARDGAEALTFRAVAREMNIAVGAFSRYFKSRAELEDEIGAAIISRMAPLDAAGRQGLRDQLLRLCMEWLRVTRAYSLLTLQGSASASALAAHLGQVVKVLTEHGIDIERAVMAYSMAINLAYSWGVQLSRKVDRKLRKQSIQAFTRKVGELTPRLEKMLEDTDVMDACRRSFALLIDDSLLAHASAPKKR